MFPALTHFRLSCVPKCAETAKIYAQEYSCGKPTTELMVVGESDSTGTTVTFKPDGSIFHHYGLRLQHSCKPSSRPRIPECGITLHLSDKRELDAEGSLAARLSTARTVWKEFVEYIDANKEPLINDVIDLNTERAGIPVEVAFTAGAIPAIFRAQHTEAVFLTTILTCPRHSATQCSYAPLRLSCYAKRHQLQAIYWLL